MNWDLVALLFLFFNSNLSADAIQCRAKSNSEIRGFSLSLYGQIMGMLKTLKNKTKNASFNKCHFRIPKSMAHNHKPINITCELQRGIHLLNQYFHACNTSSHSIISREFDKLKASFREYANRYIHENEDFELDEDDEYFSTCDYKLFSYLHMVLREHKQLVENLPTGTNSSRKRSRAYLRNCKT